MSTIKQVEAFYWSSTLGSFEAAAQKLNTAPSTISKRIQEFELESKAILFDRSKRSVRLTVKGEEILTLAEEMLTRRNLLEMALHTPESFSGRFSFGVTELIALTWLPKLVASIKAKYPNLRLTFEVNTSAKLYERLSNHQIDLALAAAGGDLSFDRVQLTELELAWMANPSLVIHDHLTVREIAAYPLLLPVGSSGMQTIVEQLLRTAGAKAANVITSNSMSALSELAVAGVGVACLPKIYFFPKLRDGVLKTIQSQPAVPRISYVATYRNDATELSADIALMAVDLCDFRHPRQKPEYEAGRQF